VAVSALEKVEAFQAVVVSREMVVVGLNLQVWAQEVVVSHHLECSKGASQDGLFPWEYMEAPW